MLIEKRRPDLHVPWLLQDIRITKFILVVSIHVTAKTMLNIVENKACKHIIWTLLFVCGIQEDSDILQQVSLTVEEIRQIVANTPNDIPDPLKITEATNNSTHQRQTRKEVTTNLFENDSRNGRPQIWYLERKDMKRGQTPRCRGCREEQKDGELCLSVTGLYVPYGQTFVVETNFYFCPNVSCIGRLPPWTNLKRPQMVHAKASVSDEDIRRLDLGQIRIVTSGH